MEAVDAIPNSPWTILGGYLRLAIVLGLKAPPANSPGAY